MEESTERPGRRLRPRLLTNLLNSLSCHSIVERTFW
jgi:hypothetical protein